jgi:4-alpha-glucanotransferase
MIASSPLAHRSAGVLLHVTSLPSEYGIGDMGPAAHRWIDLLAMSGQRWWQVLPLGPVGFGGSPYSASSSFALNPLLVSPAMLFEDGLLPRGEAEGGSFDTHRVDFKRVHEFKDALLRKAWERFRAGAAPALREAFEIFRKDQAAWIDDYALYAALKERHEGRAWSDWSADLAQRKPEAVARVRRNLGAAIERCAFAQFLLERQWQILRRHALSQGVGIIGDLPIFAAWDSHDVWASPEQFLLDAERHPRFVAGVPPDYFSPTGQLWGNPLYDWEEARKSGYAWWIQRMRRVLSLVDLVRLDHFRGLEAAWHVPVDAVTAEEGSWEPGPGVDLLEHLQSALGGLPLIAEDLGMITAEVHALRDRFGLPGMCVLQFAFENNPKSPFLPHNHRRNSVVYTGTHDNDTTVGWYRSLSPEEQDLVRVYTNTNGNDIAWDLIRMAWSSVASTAIVPVQDPLMLDTSARMNRPGVPDGNWTWRLTPDQPVAERLEGLGILTERYNRLPPSETPASPGPPGVTSGGTAPSHPR